MAKKNSQKKPPAKDSITSKRDDVLAATLKLTAEKGFAATSTANIAEEAKVGMGTIYRYFESKDVLLSALFDELRDKFIKVIVSSYDSEQKPQDNFRNIVFVLVRYYIDHPFEFKYLERYSDPSLKIDQRFNATTIALQPLQEMWEGRGHGIKFKKLPFFVLFAMMYGPLVAIINLVHMGKVELTDQMIYDVADSCWESVIER